MPARPASVAPPASQQQRAGAGAPPTGARRPAGPPAAHARPDGHHHPTGAGLAALGQGQPALLASAITTAFDATVLGLAAGMVGLVLGKLRRRWYEELLEEMA